MRFSRFLADSGHLLVLKNGVLTQEIFIAPAQRACYSDSEKHPKSKIHQLHCRCFGVEWVNLQ